MSHYFQQLLTSSGLVQPVLSVPSLPTNAPHSAADFTEVSEETTSVTPPGPSFVSPREVTSGFATSPEVRTTRTTRDAPPAPTPVHPEPGVVEIISSQVEEHVIRPQPTVAVSAQPPAGTAPVSSAGESSKPTAQIAPAPTTATGPAQPSTRKPAANTPAASPAPSSSSAGIPSHDELIQHVFRWVAQNPTDLTPPALGPSSSTTTEPARSTPLNPTIRPATVSSVQSSEHPFAPPARASERPSTGTKPPAPAVAAESSVEISIGTLQIQVEAPPAPAAKLSRRPATSRTTGAQSPAVMQRPAIDLNRLRRGFYI